MPASAPAAPLYRQVKEHILERIARGSLGEGDAVPSENELTRDLGVSRMTANRALRELTAEGVLRRAQGIGTFVAATKPQSELLEIRNIAAEIVARGHAHVASVRLLRRERADPATARALELKPGGAVFHSVILHNENGSPVQVEDRHVNPAFAPNYLRQDFTKTTPYEYLTGLGPLDAAEHVIEASLPDPHLQRLLQIRGNEPCLILTRRTWSNGVVVSRARLTHPGSRYRLAGRQDYLSGTTPRRSP